MCKAKQSVIVRDVADSQLNFGGMTPQAILRRLATMRYLIRAQPSEIVRVDKISLLPHPIRWDVAEVFTKEYRYDVVSCDPSWEIPKADVANKISPAKLLRKTIHKYLINHADEYSGQEVEGIETARDAILESGITTTNTGVAMLLSTEWDHERASFGDYSSCYSHNSGYAGNRWCGDAVEGYGVVCKVYTVRGDDQWEELQSRIRSGNENNDMGLARFWGMPSDDDVHMLFSNWYDRGAKGIGKHSLLSMLCEQLNKEHGTTLFATYGDIGDNYGMYVNSDKEVVIGTLSPTPSCQHGEAFDLIDVEDEYSHIEEELQNKAVCCDCGDRFYLENEGIQTASGDCVCDNCMGAYFCCEECDEWHSTDDYCTVHDFSDGEERNMCQCCVDRDDDIQSVPSWMTSLQNEGIYLLDLGR